MTTARHVPDPLDLAEEVAAGRLSMAEAERSLRSTRRDGRGADEAVTELRSLAAALEAVHRHATATRSTAAHAGSLPTGIAVAPRSVRVRVVPGRHDRGERGGRGLAVLLAATLAASGGVLAASFMGSDHPSPPPASLAGPASPPASVDPAASADAGFPTAVDPFGDSPAVVVWSMPDRATIELSSWHAARPREQQALPPRRLETWPDPDPVAGRVVERTVVVSPTATWFAVGEADPAGRARARLFDAAGTLRWSQSGAGERVDLAWSADGSQLAVDVAGTWTVVDVSSAEPVARQLPAADGQDGLRLILLGWDATGTGLIGTRSGYQLSQAAYYHVVAATGAGRLVERAGVDAPGIAISNASGGGGLIDPVTGDVLVAESPWTVRAPGEEYALGLAAAAQTSVSDARWTSDGRIVVVQTPLDEGQPAIGQHDPTYGVIQEPAAGAEPDWIGSVSWAFAGPRGSRVSAVILAQGGGHVVIGLTTRKPVDVIGSGVDELNFLPIDAPSPFAIMSLEGEGAFDMHVAGLIP